VCWPQAPNVSASKIVVILFIIRPLNDRPY